MNAQVRAAPGVPRAAAGSLPLPLIGKVTSRIGFGTGGLMRIAGARRRQEALAAALASGITHFDTAPLYGFGESELALGRFLRGRRAQVTLTTKFGLQASQLARRLVVFQSAARSALRLLPMLRRAAVRNAGVLAAAPSFSAATARTSLEKSLKALRTDYIDFFLAHQACATALPDEELVGWLEDARREGKILAFGVATDFDWLLPVLEQRPQLSRVVQFDSDPTRRDAAVVSGHGRLLITYGFIGRAVSACRERLRGLDGLDDDELGGLLMRAAVLANPDGIVLMQSRSTRRIESNARAATSSHHDDRVQDLLGLLGSGL